jgi:hypothetical protein
MMEFGVFSQQRLLLPPPAPTTPDSANFRRTRSAPACTTMTTSTFLSPFRLAAIKEEYTASFIDLGSESHDEILESAVEDDEGRMMSPEDEWAKSGLAVHTNVPPRSRGWRSSSFGEKQLVKRVLVKEEVDWDCGIW